MGSFKHEAVLKKGQPQQRHTQPFPMHSIQGRSTAVLPGKGSQDNTMQRLRGYSVHAIHGLPEEAP